MIGMNDSAKTTIAHVIIGLNVGGAELVLKRLVEADANCPHRRHVVISLTDEGTLGREFRSLGCDVFACGMKSVARDALVVLWKLVRLFRRLNPSIVQTWMYHADLLGGMAARFGGIENVSWGIRNTEISTRGSVTGSVGLRASALLSHWIPKQIICCAESARQQHIRIGYRADIMRVIPNGYSIPGPEQLAGAAQRLREQWGIDPDCLIIGNAARFDPLKDHCTLIAAAALVARQHPKVHFVLAGRDIDAGNGPLVQWIQEAGLPATFTLLGERSDIAQVMSAFDLYCLPSRAEGFPNAVAEAMSLGIPCVVTNVGDAGVLVGDTGIVVPPQDAAALARGMLQMVDMPEKARALMGSRARQRIHDRYAMREVFERYMDSYARLQGEKGFEPPR